MRRNVIALIEEQPINIGETPDTSKLTYSNNESCTNKRKHAIDAEKINVANVANHRAEAFYEEHGVKHAAAAFELTDNAYSSKRIYGTPHTNMPLMTCRYCLRCAMGYCVKRGGKQPTWKEPLLLESSDGRQVRLVFNCAKCQMEVYAL